MPSPLNINLQRFSYAARWRLCGFLEVKEVNSKENLSVALLCSIRNTKVPSVPSRTWTARTSSREKPPLILLSVRIATRIHINGESEIEEMPEEKNIQQVKIQRRRQREFTIFVKNLATRIIRRSGVLQEIRAHQERAGCLRPSFRSLERHGRREVPEKRVISLCLQQTGLITSQHVFDSRGNGDRWIQKANTFCRFPMSTFCRSRNTKTRWLSVLRKLKNYLDVFSGNHRQKTRHETAAESSSCRRRPGQCRRIFR